MEGETDPNRLYDLQRECFNFQLYTQEDVNQFCERFYDRNRDEGSLHPILDRVVDRFQSIDDDDVAEDFRIKIKAYLNMYGYVSQIINFMDIELEKSHVFFRYLYKKLPKEPNARIELLDVIDLDSLRIQKQHESIGSLEAQDAFLSPLTFESGEMIEDPMDFLSEIISKINNAYGVELTDDDKIDLSRLKQKISESPDIDKYMSADNSPDNKRKFFNDELERLLLGYVNERFDFYQKVNENPAIKRIIFQTLFNEYVGSNK